MIENNYPIFRQVDSLELSLRSTNLLKALGIKTIAELVRCSEQELLRTPNFGRKSLTEVKEELSSIGLSLGMSPTEVRLIFAKGGSHLIEQLTAEHKQCKLRCREIEREVMELLDAQRAEAV